MHLLKRLICRLRGHDFGFVVYISPSALIHCSRCGEEIQGRTAKDLIPMNDRDREYFDSLEDTHASDYT